MDSTTPDLFQLRVGVPLIVGLILVLFVGQFQVYGGVSEASLRIVGLTQTSSREVISILNETGESINVGTMKISFSSQSTSRSIPINSAFDIQTTPVTIDPFGVLKLHFGVDTKNVQNKKDPNRLFFTKPVPSRSGQVINLVDSNGEVIDSYKPGSLNEVQQLATCLTRKGVKLYGLPYCSHCQHQREMFNTAMRFLNYIDCLRYRQYCIRQEIEVVPTWKIAGDQYERVRSLSSLASLAGCPFVGEN